MTITEKYESLLAELRHLQAQVAHTDRADYSSHQRLIDAAGVRVIEFEHLHLIDEARRIDDHARLVLPQLRQFEAMLEHYKAEPLPIDPTTATAEEIEAATESRSLLVIEVRKSVATLSRMRDDIVKRLKSIKLEARAIAEKRDELSAYERTVFEELYLIDRPNRATREVITMKELAGV